MEQEQFLSVVSRDEAERRFREAVSFTPLDAETVALDEALGRVVAAHARAPVDVPGFTRADRDGFAVHAADTFGAAEETPRVLRIHDEAVTTGDVPAFELPPGCAAPIATGAVVPRGADAVVMVEDTDRARDGLSVHRAVAPGENLSHAGSDIARGETILRRGDLLSSRETGVLAAVGLAEVAVVRRPRVAIFSTGDELVAPGGPSADGTIYDSNQRILADAVREAGGVPLERGIVRDDEAALRARLDEALGEADLVLFSGGTSKGAGDLSYRVVGARGDILVHGVALKPGKPVVLAVVAGKPVVILPGFPTSAIFTFHAFVAPWVRARAGLPADAPRTVEAELARPVRSARGRTELDLVHLVRAVGGGFAAYPLGKGSGSVTTFARADGFHVVPENEERRDAGERVTVTLLGPLQAADLVVVGSHCTGLDLLLSLLRERGVTSKVVAIGSRGGLDAAARGECDVAGVHLLDPDTGAWNEPFVPGGCVLVRGYGRRQGVVSRDGAETGRLINRNRGSGTRVLIDRLLGDRRPEGYGFEVRSHQAVAAAVVAGRADWGVCIENVARGLHFRFLAEERFDFVMPAARAGSAAARGFVTLLRDPAVRRQLAEEGFIA